MIDGVCLEFTPDRFINNKTNEILVSMKYWEIPFFSGQFRICNH